ncbi:MAG: VanZ family protein [Cellulosilyticaceae bacterium]
MTIEGILRYLNEALIIGVPIFVLWGLYRTRALRQQVEAVRWKKEVTLWMLTFYVVCLLMITVFRSDISIQKILTRPHGLDTINWVPFIELQKLWGYGYLWSFTYNILGNILWFIPLGTFLPYLKEEWGMLRIVSMGTLLSLGIEVLQFVFVTGISDIDDLIFNTLGTLIGYGCYYIVHNLYKKNIKKTT